MIDRSNRDGVTVLQMRRDPANVLDLEFAGAIEASVRGELDSPETRAVVITGTGSTFSAGVDLFRLLQEGREYLDAFLDSLTRLFATVFEAPKPVVAAVNGHAIAGGGILALACDHRVMARGDGTFGLPELKVGVPLPASALAIVRSTVPQQHLREVVLLARNFDPEAARARGLVDQVVDASEILDRSIAVAAELGSVPPRTFALTKRALALPENARTGDDAVAETWADPETRAHIQGFLERTFGKASR